MIIHCSKKLAVKLADVSPTPLEGTGPLGSWHGHLFTLDRRQCVMFCHDATRYVLFLPGLRKSDFAELGSKWFRQLFTATLETLGCPTAQISQEGGTGYRADSLRFGYGPFGAGFYAHCASGFASLGGVGCQYDGVEPGCRVLQTQSSACDDPWQVALAGQGDA